MIVSVHLDDLLKTDKIPSFGTSGVDLFFVISGFVMVHTTRLNPPTPTQFMKNRLARIVPIYWLLTLTLFLVAAFEPSWVQSTVANPLQLLDSLCFIPFKKSNGFVQPLLFLGWSLNYEMFFYLLFAFGLGCRNYLLGVYGVVALLCCFVFIGLWFQPTGVILAFYTDPRILEFALGVAVALWCDRLPGQFSVRPIWLVSASIVSLGLIMAAPDVWPIIKWPSLSMFLFVGFPSAILVAAAVLLERWDWNIESALVIAVGDASYVLYLSHPYLISPLQRVALKLHPTGLVSVGLAALLIFLAVLLGYLLHIYVERPMSRLARELLSTNRLKAQPA